MRMFTLAGVGVAVAAAIIAVLVWQLGPSSSPSLPPTPDPWPIGGGSGRQLGLALADYTNDRGEYLGIPDEDVCIGDSESGYEETYFDSIIDHGLTADSELPKELAALIEQNGSRVEDYELRVINGQYVTFVSRTTRPADPRFVENGDDVRVYAELVEIVRRAANAEEPERWAIHYALGIADC